MADNQAIEKNDGLEGQGAGGESHPLLKGLRIAVVGNFNPPDSGVVYQAEVLVENFRREGAVAIPITFQQNRYLRPLSTIWELISQAGKYDLLCCQGYSRGNWINGAASIATGKLLRKPISMVYRGGGFPEFVKRRGWLVLPFLRRVDELIVPSGYLEHHASLYGLETSIIPNLIELDGWPYRRRETLEPKLLWVRHLRAGYNPWMAVEVLQLVQRRFPEATLRFAGDGYMEEEMHRRVADSGVEGVEFLGHLPLEELQQHFADCDIFINTTNVDNQPRSVLEAMACGLPVVSTNVGGLPYLIDDGVNGVLVPPRDPERMAQEVLALIDDPERALRIADGAIELVESFSWTQSRFKWAEIFSRLR